ncbi:MAG: isoleucine--tRNA ligase [Phycisphaeraceae bacterium]|nr:isoleucine--tRNA ligase [Phycisphaeraceae bacterium]
MPDTSKDYRSTLNLPKTAFAMKANLAQEEPKSAKLWAEERLFDRVKKARAAARPFVFHDGPPYANGAIHMGHLLNKGLKDIVVRSALMEGLRCDFVPGWDCHGLPIEHQVVTELEKKGKLERILALPEEQRRLVIRRQCAEHATKHVELQRSQLQRLLTFGDYENPYLTTQPTFEAAALELFARIIDEGLVFRALKPVHWSIASRTALAEAELEYKEREDPSIYVDFEAASRDRVASAFGVELDATPSFMIWTTTPWTLPANLAIAVQAKSRYALIRMDGAETIVAADLVDAVVKAVDAKAVERIAECDGAALVGAEYRHPFIDRTGRIVAADHVTLEDGTGLVHTAPGHGSEDYHTGLREGLEIYCPVRADGTYDDSVPEWLRGRSVWEGNTLVLARLEESGHLVHSKTFLHSYPHDWRSKTPVIFRATEQWFIGVDMPTASRQRSLRAMALEAVEAKIHFLPEWSRNRLRGMLESRPDWCISRQRSWGLPIPAFRMPDGRIFMTAASVRAVALRVASMGSDAWCAETPEQLLAAYDASRDREAPQGLDLSKLEKLHDIFDVWFESGVTWFTVMESRGLGNPSDLYLEGSDQHRGWFQASLLPALATTGEPPYRTLLTHGFIVDRNGRKMSKSEGNAIALDDLFRDYGADVCRWWLGGISYDGDIRADLEFFKRSGESYRKIRNTLRFLLSNLGDLPEPIRHAAAQQGAADPALAQVPPRSIDGWALAALAALEAEVRRGLREYDFRCASQAIFDFCNETLSTIYCAATKDRLYCDRPDAPRRRRTQRVMWECVEVLCRLLAPFTPHTANEAFQALRQDASARLELEVHRGLSFTADAGWERVMARRSQVLKALEEAKARGIENPLDAGVSLPDPDGALEPFAAELADLFGVSRVTLDRTAADERGPEIDDLRQEPRCERSWRRDRTVRQRGDGGWLSDRDAEAVGVT